MADTQDNTGLYFVVGGLLVAVVAFGLYYFGAIGNRDAGPSTTTASVAESVTPAAGAPDIDVNINKDRKD